MSKINFYLQVQPNTSKNEYKWLPLCNYKGQLNFISSINTDNIKCELTLINSNGNIVNSLHNNQIYFLCYIGKRGKKYYLYKEKNVLKFIDSNTLNGRVFIYFQGEDTFYIETTNMVGYTFVHGNDVSDSKLLWTNTYDFITLKPITYAINMNGKNDIFIAGEEEQVSTVLSKACTVNCINKKCDEDNGCGSPCGCNKNSTCKEGKCVNNISDPKKCDKNICSGDCYGKCPNGSICSRMGNGYKCKTVEKVPIWLPILIVIICSLIIIALVLISYYMYNKSISENTSVTIDNKFTDNTNVYGIDRGEKEIL